MEQQIHTVHFKADKKLLDFINDKIKKLQLFNQAITSIEVFLILENDKEKQNKITEVKVHLPGIELFAKKHAKSFEESIDVSFEAIANKSKRTKKNKDLYLFSFFCTFKVQS